MVCMLSKDNTGEEINSPCCYTSLRANVNLGKREKKKEVHFCYAEVIWNHKCKLIGSSDKKNNKKRVSMDKGATSSFCSPLGEPGSFRMLWIWLNLGVWTLNLPTLCRGTVGSLSSAHTVHAAEVALVKCVSLYTESTQISLLLLCYLLAQAGHWPGYAGDGWSSPGGSVQVMGTQHRWWALLS